MQGARLGLVKSDTAARDPFQVGRAIPGLPGDHQVGLQRQQGLAVQPAGAADAGQTGQSAVPGTPDGDAHQPVACAGSHDQLGRVWGQRHNALCRLWQRYPSSEVVHRPRRMGDSKSWQ